MLHSKNESLLGWVVLNGQAQQKLRGGNDPVGGGENKKLPGSSTTAPPPPGD